MSKKITKEELSVCLKKAGCMAHAVEKVLLCKDPLALSDRLRILQDAFMEYNDTVISVSFK